MHRRLFYNEQDGLMRTAKLVAPRLLSRREQRRGYRAAVIVSCSFIHQSPSAQDERCYLTGLIMKPRSSLSLTAQCLH